MAVTTDLGEANNIHPKNKQEVGLRLSQLALKQTYKKKGCHNHLFSKAIV